MIRTETDMLGAYYRMEAGAVMSFKGDTFKISDGLKIWNKRANKWLPCLRSLNSLVGAWWEVDAQKGVENYKPIGDKIHFRQAWSLMIEGRVYSFNNQVFKYDRGLKSLRSGQWVNAITPLEDLVNCLGFEMVKC